MAYTILNVAEKPAMARQIARALYQGQAAHGQGSPPVIEFPFTLPGRGPVRMVFTSTIGHMQELEFEYPYRCVASLRPSSRLRATRCRTCRPPRSLQQVGLLQSRGPL